MIKWFWDIVLNEWDDEKRRKLLSFSTGSDRAPVNGLKSLKFYIIKEEGDDKKLPSSHTCFN
jgi:HECT-domain (ubiquitin-transferase)